MTQNLPIHPDDVLLFLEIKKAMERVAKQYELPLKSVSALSMPTKGMCDRLGECSAGGDIRLVMRATVDGEFCDEPRTPDAIWKTAAHELAHLRHFNHGVAFQEFQDELEVAIGHQQVTHRQKVIDRLVKMQAQRDDAAKRASGKTTDAECAQAEAEAFAGMINKMMLEHELNPSDLDYARATDNDPVIEIKVNLEKYQIEKKKARVAWQESLARVVAEAHLCKFLVVAGKNNIWFVGTTSHATVAEYVFGTLVPTTDRMSWAAYNKFFYGLKGRGEDVTQARGFRAAWLDAFVNRIQERFTEVRRAAVADVAQATGVSSATGLMRLNGALIKAQRYCDDKFSSSGRSVQSARMGRSNNMAGRAAGRAAADKMTLGRKGLTSSAGPVRGLLGR